MGVCIKRVDIKGKVMFICFDNGYIIYLYNQFYGKWYVCLFYNYLFINRQLCFVIYNEKKLVLFYSVFDIEVLCDEEVFVYFFVLRVGLDILSEEVMVNEFLDCFYFK